MLNILLFRIISSSSASVSCTGSDSSNCNTGLPQITGGSTELQAILQITFGIVAAISVLFVVIGGLRFVLSAGNPENVAKARETILYALLGLIVSLVAEGIVVFVIKKI
ncbi:MAG TPA: hypothetical protein VIH90_02280 [Candidatus Saccharimonadales bacterium]